MIQIVNIILILMSNHIGFYVDKNIERHIMSIMGGQF